MDSTHGVLAGRELPVPLRSAVAMLDPDPVPSQGIGIPSDHKGHRIQATGLGDSCYTHHPTHSDGAGCGCGWQEAGPGRHHAHVS